MRRPRSIRQWALVAVAAVVVLAAVGAAYLRWDSPLRRTWVEHALQQRYGVPVSLQTFHSSLFPRARVSGTGLVLGGGPPGAPPLIQIASFSANASWFRLLFGARRLGYVQLQGLQLNIPPKRSGPVHKRFRSALVLESVIADGTVLRIDSSQPGKRPRTFYIQHLRLRAAPGRDRGMLYQARLTNPKPVGQIAATGAFGPWDDGDPGSTPLSGKYAFTHADLSTINGLAGMLSSQGAFDGSLREIEVHGTSYTPDFSLGQDGNAMPLQAVFQLLVDGTSGDTLLQTVRARLGSSALDVTGIVQPSPLPGSEVDLDVAAGNSGQPARLEDLLGLAVRTTQPPMKGNVTLRAHIHVPPGSPAVDKRMRMRGQFEIGQATFTDPEVRSKLSDLSLRGQGNARAAAAGDVVPTVVALQGEFQMGKGLVQFSQLQFAVPGATIRLHGSYDVPSQALDFQGTVALDAKISQTTTGWKSLMLHPFNRVFEHGTTGTLLPIAITGQRAHPNFRVNVKQAITGHGLGH